LNRRPWKPRLPVPRDHTGTWEDITGAAVHRGTTRTGPQDGHRVRC